MGPEVSTVLLAAGMSRRMGVCKQLLPIGGRTFILCCIDRITGAGVRDIVAVLGPRGDRTADKVADAVSGLPVTIVRNPDPESDMAGSARAGVRAVSPASKGVLVCLADHPLVAPDTYGKLLFLHEREPGAILIPVHEGRRGHPTLFPRPLMDELATHKSLRDLIHAHAGAVRLVDVADMGVAIDIDTPEDYREAARIFAAT